MNVTQAARKLGMTRAEYLNERDGAWAKVSEIRRQLYADYLQSPEWKRKRAPILARDKICRVCGKEKSKEVHHLSYAHIYHESRYDLIGVCSSCHQHLHIMGIPHWGNILG